MVSSGNNSDSEKPKPRRAKTTEERENQMINLALDQAELQLREGSAATPVVVHYLKLATQRSKLEEEKLRRENILLEKRAEQIESGQRVEELYSEAIIAMRKYQGYGDESDSDD